LESLRGQFSDEDYRYGFAEAFLNSYIAAQIKIIREQQEMTQAQLAEKIGTKQAGISRLENVNYRAWRVETLTRLARAFRLRLRISFEEFGTLPDEVDNFGKESLERAPFDEDPIFGTVSDRAQESVPLTDNERQALAAMRDAPATGTLGLDATRMSNLRQFEKNQTVFALNGETNARDVDSYGKNSGFHGTGGVEPWKQGFSARPSDEIERALSVQQQQQYG
jgi:transcriptional regulator with XRE-family HTH domain